VEKQYLLAMRDIYDINGVGELYEFVTSLDMVGGSILVD